MDLFEEIIPIDSNENLKIRSNNHPRVEYEKLYIEEPCERNISSLTQYFLAPFILVDSNGILDIPVFDNDIQNIVLKEIAPHFSRVTKVTINNNVNIRVQKIKESSKIRFLNQVNNRSINAIVNDIYLQESTRWEGNFTIREYKVNLEAVKKLSDNDILPLWDFFYRTFVRAQENMVILPNGWAFNESFKDRIAVQSFASVCHSMTVIVNQENNLITSILIN
jgi:hypothetical protein